jgi:hypothetical protein
MIQKFIKITYILSSRFVKNSGGKEGHKENIKNMEDSCDISNENCRQNQGMHLYLESLRTVLKLLHHKKFCAGNLR